MIFPLTDVGTPAGPAPTQRVAWPIITDRLTITALEAADIAHLLPYRCDPHVVRWTSCTDVDPQRATARLTDVLADPWQVAMVARVDGTVVGDGVLRIHDAWSQNHHPVATRAQAGIGYALAPAAMGQGLGTELLTAMLIVAFDHLGLYRVEAGCYAANIGSWRVMEKAGLRREGYYIAESYHDVDGWCDGITYALLRDEWATGIHRQPGSLHP